jgi:dolichol-phosphate mannosyltransferase
MKTLIIIPTYNERENIPRLLEEIFQYATNTDILIVDDNSPDGTGKLADQYAENDERVRVLHRAGKLGLGTAYIAGFQYAIEHAYEAAFEMDADFSHQPKFLPDFLKKIETADLVIGSRYIHGGTTPDWPLFRKVISGGGNLYIRLMLGIPIHDCTAGYRCYRTDLLKGIKLETIQLQGYAFQIEMTYRAWKSGYRIVETPIAFPDRQLGTSKMSGKIIAEGFFHVLKTRFRTTATINMKVSDKEPLLLRK